MLLNDSDLRALVGATIEELLERFGAKVPDLVKACPRAFVIGKAAVIHGIWAFAAIAITFIIVKLGVRG